MGPSRRHPPRRRRTRRRRPHRPRPTPARDSTAARTAPPLPHHGHEGPRRRLGQRRHRHLRPRRHRHGRRRLHLPPTAARRTEVSRLGRPRPDRPPRTRRPHPRRRRLLRARPTSRRRTTPPPGHQALSDARDPPRRACTSSPPRSPCAVNASPTTSPPTHPTGSPGWYGPPPRRPRRRPSVGRRNHPARRLARRPPPRPRHPRLRTPTDHPRPRARWHEHLDRSLDTRCWLHAHHPTLAAAHQRPVDIAAVRARLDELDPSSPPPHPTRPASSTPSAPATSPPTTSTKPSRHRRRPTPTTPMDPRALAPRRRTRRTHPHQQPPRPPRPLAHHRPTDVADLLDQAHRHQRRHPRDRHPRELDDQLAHTHPAAITARLQAEQAQLNQRLTIVDTALLQADNDQRGLLRQHRHRLTARIHHLTAQINGHAARVALWEWGHRPDPLTATIARRANHLAHAAITRREQWLITAVTAWHHHHPHGTPDELHHTLTDIAAYRERAGHDTLDPLGPTQPDHDLETRRGTSTTNSTTHPPPPSTTASTAERQRASNPHPDAVKLLNTLTPS